MDSAPEAGQIEDYIYQITASPLFGGGKKEVCFAARAAGLFRSQDGGASWQPAYASLNLPASLPTLSVAVPQDDAQDLTVLTGVGGGILRSSDGGLTWENIPLPPPPPVVSALVFSPNYAQDGIVLAGSMEDGVLFSYNRGRSFTSWNFGLLDLNILCLAVSPDFASDENLYVGTQSGIFRSTNGGRAWREVDLPFGFEAVISLAISPGFKKNQTLFAGTESKGLWRSVDGGKTWHSCASQSLVDPINTILLSPNYPDQGEILVLHGTQLLHSTEDGKNWKAWQSRKIKQPVIAILAPRGFQPDAPALIGFEDGSILRLN